MGVAPVLYGLYAALATLLVVRARLPFKYRILTPFAVTAALPFMNFAALKFGEAGFDVLKYVDCFFQFFDINFGPQVVTAVDTRGPSWAAEAA